MFVLERESERQMERNECERGQRGEMLSKREWEQLNNKHLPDREIPFKKWLIRFHCTLLLKARTLGQNYMFLSTVSKKICIE